MDVPRTDDWVSVWLIGIAALGGSTPSLVLQLRREGRLRLRRTGEARSGETRIWDLFTWPACRL